MTLGMRGFKFPTVNPDFGLFDYGRKGSKKGKSFKGRYAIDLASNVLDLKTDKVSDLYRKGFGAFVQRRILTGRKVSTRGKSSPRTAPRRQKRRIRRDWWLR